MGNPEISTVVAILFAITPIAPSQASAPDSGLPESALVLVVSRFFSGEQAGNGFVVGDGTLAVTNDHLVYEQSEKGDHRLEGFVAVFSPYLGEMCSARILASDEELDLSVLEVPWRGHPALALADANTVMSMRSAHVTGLPAVVKRLSDWDTGGMDVETFTPDEEELPISLTSVWMQVPRVVTLKGIGKLGRGWSGSPMLVPGTSTVVGCFGRVRRSSILPHPITQRAQGPAVCRVPRLLGGSFDKGRLCRTDALLRCPEDAHEACSAALRASSMLRPGQYESAIEPVLAFLKRRPDSAAGQRMLAYASEKIGRMDVAREAYRRATELDPDSLNGQLLYAQFLAGQGDMNGAQQILEPLWQAGRSRDLVAMALVNLWSEHKEFARCIQILEAATRSNPRNAYLWQQMTACRMQTEGPDAAIGPLNRVVELYPERGPFRGSLARLLETTGRLDEAEIHFRKLLEIEPDNPVVYLWLAEFLSKHRPPAQAEALKMAEKALALPPRLSLSRDKIEKLVAEIHSRTKSNSQK